MTLPCGALLRRPAEAAIRLASSCNSRDHLPPPDLAAGDPAEDESASRHAAGAPAESPTDQCDGVGISRLPRDVNVRVRLAAFDAIAHLRVEDDAGAVVDRVALLLAAGAESYGGDADLVRGYRRHVRGPCRPKCLDPRRSRQLRRIVHLRDIAALGGDELAELREAAAVGERALDAGERPLPGARFPAGDG